LSVPEHDPLIVKTKQIARMSAAEARDKNYNAASCTLLCLENEGLELVSFIAQVAETSGSESHPAPC